MDESILGSVPHLAELEGQGAQTGLNSTANSAPEQYVPQQPTGVNALQQEIDRMEMRETMKGMEEKIKRMEGKGEEQKGGEMQDKMWSVIEGRASNIATLSYRDLGDLDAAGIVQLFGTQVESCTRSDVGRMSQALAKMEQQLALVMQGKMNKGKITSWGEMKQELNDSIDDREFCEAVDELGELQYDEKYSPYQFSQIILSKVDRLQQRFPTKSIPIFIKQTKQTLMRSLPPKIQHKLLPWMEDSVSVEDFVEPLVRYMQTIRTLHNIYPGRVNKIEVEKPQPSAVEPSRIEKLEGKVDSLCKLLEGHMVDNRKYQGPTPTDWDQRGHVPQQDFQNRGYTGPYFPPHYPSTQRQDHYPPQQRQDQLQIREITDRPHKHCTICNTGTHNTVDCYSRNRACFDCGRRQCWRGKEGCPGKGSKVQRT